MVAPPYFSVPPDGYGGVEAVVADLVDALVERGLRITLVASGPHRTRAQAFLPTSDRGHPEQLGEALPEVAHAAHVARLLEDVEADLVHDHTLAGPLLARGRSCPTVATVHGSLGGAAGEYYRAIAGAVCLVAISSAQARTAPSLPWAATIHNAVSVETFPFQADKERMALFLGRFHPEKAPHLAIDAARRAGLPIVLAGKCSEPVERAYFEREVRPRLADDTTLVGVAGPAAKRELLARASCLLFPICWEEPFGLVMVEAMACGTPVVAVRRGSVAEVVVDGVTGIVVDSSDELADAVHRACRLDPADCRRHATTVFSPARMAAHYDELYRRALADRIPVDADAPVAERHLASASN
jgi:glycosyltransferase involved in cell wall biosynthesis